VHSRIHHAAQRPSRQTNERRGASEIEKEEGVHDGISAKVLRRLIHNTASALWSNHGQIMVKSWSKPWSNGPWSARKIVDHVYYFDHVMVKLWSIMVNRLTTIFHFRLLTRVKSWSTLTILDHDLTMNAIFDHEF
jgi:hypothetical protein